MTAKKTIEDIKMIIRSRKEIALNNIMMIIEDLKSILKTMWNNIDTHLKITTKSGGMIERESMRISKIIINKIKVKNIQNGKGMARKSRLKVI